MLDIQKESHRTKRVNDLIQRQLASIIHLEMKGAQQSMVTVTKVDVSPNFAHAKVFVTLFSGKEMNESDKKSELALLKKAAGFLRSKLAKKIHLRSIPELRFYLDDFIEKSQRMQTIFNEIALSNKE